MKLDETHWIVRRRGRDEVHALRRRAKPIVSERTPYQQVEIVETRQYGKALLLDGVYQSSEFDQLLKHEVLVHPVMSLVQGQAIDVLVIGGGEGGVIREVLRHHNVESVTMLELDERVPALCQEHLCWDQGAFSSPKLGLYYGDASATLPKLAKRRKFDVIIVDSTQPADGSVAAPLVQTSFLLEIKRRLRPGGLVAGFGINAAPIARQLRSDIRTRTLGVIGGTLIEYVVPCPFYSASFAFQLSASASTQGLHDLVQERFNALRLVGDRSLDSISLRSYLSIPWGYRLDLHLSSDHAGGARPAGHQ